MNEQSNNLNNHGFGNVANPVSAISDAVARNRVLRNTYVLLAISLVPTVLGAWFGIATGASKMMGGIMGMVIFLAGAFGLIYMITKNKDRTAGVYWLLGFTFFMGLMLSSLLARVLGFKNGASLVMTAFGGTAGIFFVMATLATTIKRDLAGMQKWLFWGAMVIVVSAIINVFIGSTALMAAISTLALAVFSAYMLYDIKQVMDGGETNYVSATLAIYLDLINIFQSLLALLGIFGGEKD